MPRQDLAQGALLMILAEFAFASMGALIRLLSGEVSNEVIVFFRNAVGLLLFLPWLLRQGGAGLRTTVPGLHLLRSLVGLGAMYCFFYSIAHMPLAEAMLLKLTAPLFIPFVALLWLGEGIPWRVRWALLIGFGGVAVILAPRLTPHSFDDAKIGLIAVAGGLLAALAITTVRRLGRTEPAKRTVFYFSLIATLASALPLAWAWSTPRPLAWAGLFGVGVLATLGQLLLTRSLALAPAGRVGPFAYASVLFAAAYGWLGWGETIGALGGAGGLLVLLSLWLARSTGDTAAGRKPLAP
jgi:drug/metabolite transporter (DMT)-like permease